MQVRGIPQKMLEANSHARVCSKLQGKRSMSDPC